MAQINDLCKHKRMENYGRAMELATSATESEGAAMEKYSIYQDSVAAGLDRINALWETFIINLGEDDAIKSWVSFFEQIMKFVSSKEFTTFLTWGTFPITIAIGVSKLIPAIKTMTTATDEAAIASAKLTRSWSTFAIAIAGIALAIQVITYIATAQERLRESLDETIESINSVDSELENLQSELNSINEQIDELNSKDKLTFVEKDQLDDLREASSEIENQIALLEAQRKVDSRGAYNDALKLMDSKQFSTLRANMYSSGLSENSYSMVNPEEALKESLEAMKYMNSIIETGYLPEGELRDQLQNVLINPIEGIYAVDENGKINNLEEWKAYYAQLEETALNAYSDILNAKVAFENYGDEARAESLQEAIDVYSDYYAKTEDKFNKVFNKEEYQDISNYMLDLAKNGSLSVETIQNSMDDDKVNQYMQEFFNLGLTVEDVTRLINGLAEAQQEQQEATVNANIQLKTYGGIIGEVQEKMELILTAQREMNENGVVSVDTVADMEEAFGDLAGVLKLTDAGFITNTESLNTLIDSMGAQYELELNNAMDAAQAILNAEGIKASSYERTTQAIKEQLMAEQALIKKEYYSSIPESLQGLSTSEYYRKQQVMSDERYQAINQAIKDIETAEENYKNYKDIVNAITIDDYNSSSDSSSSSSSGSSPSEEETAYERLNRILEHKLFLAQQLADAYEDDAEKQKEYLDTLAMEEDILNQLQDAAHKEAERLRGEGKTDNDKEIQDLQQAWWEYESEKRNLAKETQDYLDNLAEQEEQNIEDITSRLREAVEWLLEDAQMKLDETLDHNDYLISQLDAIVSLTEEYYSTMNTVRSEMKNINDELEISKQSYKYLDEELRKTIFNEEDYNKLSKKLQNIASESEDMYAEYMNELSSLTEDNIWKVEEITNEFKRQYELKQMEYDIAKNELDLVKAQTELQNTLANRNVRMFTGGEWIWTSDYQAVQNAMQNVADAENELENSEIEYQQQQVINQYNSMIDTIQLQSDAAQHTYDEWSDLWDKIVHEWDKPVDTVSSILNEIAESSLPKLKSIISSVGVYLSQLLNGLGESQYGSSWGYSGSVDKNPLSSNNGTITTEQYLKNKVAWQQAMENGDIETANRLHQQNEQYRKDNGILTDKISTETAKDMLGSGVYDSGGILRGIGGIKATNMDEVIFDGGISSKILNPEKSKSFFEVADALSKMLDNSSGINSLLTAISNIVNPNTINNTDSHDIYLPNGFQTSMAKSDYDNISSVIRRYIPITR